MWNKCIAASVSTHDLKGAGAPMSRVSMRWVTIQSMGIYLFCEIWFNTFGKVEVVNRRNHDDSYDFALKIIHSVLRMKTVAEICWSVGDAMNVGQLLLFIHFGFFVRSFEICAYILFDDEHVHSFLPNRIPILQSPMRSRILTPVIRSI